MDSLTQANDIEYSTSTTSRAFTGLPSDTDYTFMVRAKNAGGYSSYSALKSARTLLKTPENVRATPDIFSILINWNQVEGADRYEVRFDGEVYEVTDSWIELDQLLPETSYTYSVRALNDYGVSKHSSTETVKTLEDSLNAPTNVDATATMNEVKVFWDEVKGATSYIVNFDEKFYSVAADTRTFRVAKAAKPSEPKYRFFPGLSPNTEHTYCVKAVNDRCVSHYSKEKKITTKKSKKSGLPNAKSRKRYPDGRRSHTGLDPVNALTGAFLWSYTYLEDYGKDQLHFGLSTLF